MEVHGVASQAGDVSGGDVHWACLRNAGRGNPGFTAQLH